MKNTFFSIIIPTLNEQECLPLLLKCLKNQTYKDFEVIVVDGNSDDNTIKNAQKFSGNIKLTIKSTKRRNVSYQRNAGAKRAKGDYFIFFDADVTVGDDFLEKINAYIQKEESLLFTTWLTSDDKQMLNELIMTLANYGIMIARHTSQPFIPGTNIIVENNVFRSIGGFDETVKNAEDHYFAYIAHKKGIVLRFVEDISINASLRRFKSEGRLTVMRKYAYAATYYLFKGPIRTEIFEYEMGGGYHKSAKPKTLKEHIERIVPFSKMPMSYKDIPGFK